MATFVSLKQKMKEWSSYRKMMIAAGFLAAITILLSPVFQRETRKALIEAQAKSDAKGEDKQLVIVAASDAMTTSQAVQVEPAKPFVVQEVITVPQHTSATPVPDITFPVSAVTTLLRTVLSPQAP